jgi:hypothetical protein
MSFKDDETVILLLGVSFINKRVKDIQLEMTPLAVLYKKRDLWSAKKRSDHSHCIENRPNIYPRNSHSARIFKLSMSPRIDSKEPIPPGCLAWRSGATTIFLLGSYPPYIV